MNFPGEEVILDLVLQVFIAVGHPGKEDNCPSSFVFLSVSGKG